MAPLAHTCGYASKPEPVSGIPQTLPKYLLDTYFKAVTPDSWPSLPWLLPLCEYSQCMVLSLAPLLLSCPRHTLFSPSPISLPSPGHTQSTSLCSGLMQMHLAVLALESTTETLTISWRDHVSTFFTHHRPLPCLNKTSLTGSVFYNVYLYQV